MTNYPQLIDKIALNIHNVSRDGNEPVNKRGIIDGTSTQSVGVKVHLNATPALNGVEYPGYDGTIRGLVKEDGRSPCIDWRWTVDGKMAWNSAERPDIFEFGSYEGDGGCTPAMNLTTPVGPGRHEVKVWALIEGRYNGGVHVESKQITWYVD